ncbi:hypothetical protein O7621_25935 [Solwaraspora sp. WMMD937]|uniref:hypothetical protein n=1 Tax=Solwaraspora sp. WMMD937 TaxID=3016090 RepID=UPI002499B9CA|nr:hypothetical protein [Solwaraspora sp. WMMD937]WFE21250.1 hypothetical protein O7621_25935 [Solwaraspora sp. WMMD937]
MREQVEQRVAELEAELRAGQQMLAEVEARRADIQQTLLRITGAIQVLNELLAVGPSAGPVAAGTARDAVGTPAATAGTGTAPGAVPDRLVPQPL